MKIQKVKDTISPIGGISFVNNAFNKIGLSQLVDNDLGTSGSAIAIVIVKSFEI